MIRALRAILLFVVLGISLVAMHQTPAPLPTLDRRNGPVLSAVSVWGYQLQNARPGLIDPAIDLLVVDYARDGRHQTAFRPSDVEAFRTRPDGNKRIVLAYLSIGEAESYRYYWNSTWAGGSSPLAPGWLGPENPEWKGNYKVRFWHPGWQNILLQSERTLLDRLIEMFAPARRAYLDHIIDAGFDGVYLDRVDIYEDWKSERPSAEGDMIALVARISAHAKARRPGFLVVAQNGEELLRNGAYRSVIDTVAKEDLLYGITRGESENSPEDVNRSVLLLNRIRAPNRPVLVVEYLDDTAKRAEAARRAQSLGYLIHFAPRELNRPPVPYKPAPLAPETAPASDRTPSRKGDSSD